MGCEEPKLVVVNTMIHSHARSTRGLSLQGWNMLPHHACTLLHTALAVTGGRVIF